VAQRWSCWRQSIPGLRTTLYASLPGCTVRERERIPYVCARRTARSQRNRERIADTDHSACLIWVLALLLVAVQQNSEAPTLTRTCSRKWNRARLVRRRKILVRRACSTVAISVRAPRPAKNSNASSGLTFSWNQERRSSAASYCTVLLLGQKYLRS